jgi:hypothetical protein
MLFNQRGAGAALFLLAMVAGRPVHAQAQYEDVNGVRFQVTRQVVPRQIPVTKTQEQQSTTYRQQVTTENVQHQQVYNVPVTQYQIVSRLHGRWNPFVQPYWTHHYQPVTTWQQQVGTVQIPVTKVAWAPETRTVQQPVTTWETHNQEIVTKTPIGPTPLGGASNTALASRPLSGGSSPSATISPMTSGSPAASVASRPLGGEALQSDPPRQATGWQAPPTSRY